MNYYPKRPVKSFQDLEVYQKLLAISVAIVKRITLERPSADLDRICKHDPADVLIQDIQDCVSHCQSKLPPLILCDSETAGRQSGYWKRLWLAVIK